MLTCDLTLSPATTVTSQGWSRNLCWAAVVGDLSTNTTRKILTMVLVSGEGDIGLVWLYHSHTHSLLQQ